MWFTNYTFIEGEPTLPDYMRTFDDIHYGPWDIDLYKRNPWKHPGSAPVFSPCGILGGNPNGCPEVKFNYPFPLLKTNQRHQGEGEPGDQCPGGGSAYGPAAENLPWEVRKVKL